MAIVRFSRRATQTLWGGATLIVAIVFGFVSLFFVSSPRIFQSGVNVAHADAPPPPPPSCSSCGASCSGGDSGCGDSGCDSGGGGCCK